MVQVILILSQDSCFNILKILIVIISSSNSSSCHLACNHHQIILRNFGASQQVPWYTTACWQIRDGSHFVSIPIISFQNSMCLKPQKFANIAVTACEPVRKKHYCLSEVMALNQPFFVSRSSFLHTYLTQLIMVCFILVSYVIG